MQNRPITSLSLPKYLMQELERIQKRAMSIICPSGSYHEALVIINFNELATHHNKICESHFHKIVNDNNHRLCKLLPAPHESTYSLRRARPFIMPRFKTIVLRIALLSFHVLKHSGRAGHKILPRNPSSNNTDNFICTVGRTRAVIVASYCPLLFSLPGRC